MARRKITETEDLGPQELPDLTDKQMRYVLARMEGKNKSDAVRASTDTSAWSAPAIWAEGHKIENNPTVRLWLDMAKASAAEQGGYTLADHVEELDRLKTLAANSGNLGAAVQAAQLKGKALGFYVEKHEDVTPRADELLTRARAIMGDEWLDSEQGKRLLKRVEH